MKSRTRALRWLAAAGCAAWPALGAAQAPPPSRAEDPALTLPPARAELVQIDVAVTDRSGQAIRGLRAEDFEVLEDGRRQRVTHFREGRGQPRPVLVEAPPGAAPAASPAAPLAEERTPRYIVLAVDDLHMAPGSLLQAKRAFRRFVDEQVGEDDLVALIATSGALGQVHPFSRPGVALTRAIERLTPRPRPDPSANPSLQMTEYQAELVDRGDPDAMRLAVEQIIQWQPGMTREMAMRDAQATAHRIVSETGHRSRATLGTLEDVVRSLAPLAGRKMMVLASDGFLVGLGTRNSQAYDLRRIVDAATRSGVVLYGVDTRGLAGMAGFDASSPWTPVMGAPGVRESIERASEHALRDAMHSLAEDTGGFLVAGSNDLVAGFKRIMADTEARYVLAYEPANSARDGKFRKIEVKLPGRRGVRIRTRRGYFAPDDRHAPTVADLRAQAEKTTAARREADLQRGLSSLFPLRELPVRLSADFVRLPPAGSQVVVTAAIDLAPVTFVEVGGKQEAALEVVAIVYDDKGEVAANLQAERVAMSLGTDRHRQVIQDGLRYQKSAPLPPGVYDVRLVVREESTGRLGSAAEWVEVPDVGAGKLSLSSLFLSSGVRPANADPAKGAAAEQMREVQATKRFRRGEALYFQLYVYNAARDAAGAADVVLQAQVWAGPKLLAASPVSAVAAGDRDGPPVVHTSRFPLDAFGTGSYELRVAVNDRQSGQKQLRRVTFLVE